MQSWHIKALEREMSAFKELDGFIHEHAFYFLVGIIYLLLALMIWVLTVALRQKGRAAAYRIPPIIFIHLPAPRPLPEEPPFDPFPPPQHLAYDDHHDDLDGHHMNGKALAENSRPAFYFNPS